MARKAPRKRPRNAPVRSKRSTGVAAQDAVKNKPLNRSLHAARATKQDEFYTQLSDIEKELKHYANHFKGKTVLCNCDDPKISNFFHYFSHNFHKLGLKRLITTCYKNVDPDIFSRHEGKRGLRLIYDGEQTSGGRVPALSKLDAKALAEDGDFRSDECIQLLKQADIVVTNPPFSLFREYVGQLVKHKKKFVMIANKNAITYKETFTLIKENRLWIGNTPMGADMLFEVSERFGRELVANKKQGSAYRMVNGRIMARSQSCWFTNLDIAKRHEMLPLYKAYEGNAGDYLTYDNYKAINIDKTKDIPVDYNGVMGVPISFLDKYNPDQFEIIGLIAGNIRGLAGIPSASGKDGPYIDGRLRYGRILIRRK